MAIARSTSDIPKNPAERREWIRMRLRLAGHTWRSLARQIGVSHQAIQQTASGRSSIPIEEALARTLGFTAQELFPEHWSTDGARIPVERPAFWRAKNNVLQPPVHVQKREVA
ncbi:helix-turn-helix domain-containing protein [Ancylobacter sp. G4_0304]|uniref:helix-turn-helix domain-containing protein n=1 Tax=Ancylobacter sp. G4_0304 TaxID=3114289 RepID=UPI0039C714A5